MENIDYFFVAYIIVWIVLFLYLFSISRRERRIEREMAELNRAASRSAENLGDR